MMVSPALFVLKRCSKDGLNGNKRTCVRKNGVSKACLLDSLRGILLSEPRTRSKNKSPKTRVEDK